MKQYPVNLPQTAFSMRADLPQKEPVWLDSWAKAGLYRKTLEARKEGQQFILHDGPPYANGAIHMGHALNKVLKDIVNRYKNLSGYRTPYIPGWDCHGLPIEQALLKELKISKKEAMADPVRFRAKCREFALKMIHIQKQDFMRLGILGDWDNSYATMDQAYTAKIVDAFVRLYQDGYVYKGKKAVLWCIFCETALAAAEVEYQNKASASIYAAFPVVSGHSGKGGYFVGVWTTTPWTLPANRAVCVNPKATYAVLTLPDGRHIVVAQSLQDKLVKLWGAKPGKEKFTAKEMLSWKLASPLAKLEVPVISDDSVSLEEGTGLVHTAPGHGEIDFEWGKKFKLPIVCPIDATGRFTDEAPWPELVGQRVSEEDTTKLLLNLLGDQLLRTETIQHSYPHCWRCKNPLVFRATEQWFMNIEHSDLRQRILKAIENTRWVPEGSQERIKAMVEQRPDWCLSRQRIWGVPIPIVYCEGCGKANGSQSIMRAISDKVEREGVDFWFEPKGLFLKELGERFPCPDCSGKNYQKDQNILDVWLDSGVSWLAVVEGQGLGFPADLYLEGSDQHRAWFQTSLITSVALKSVPPYRAVYTNGWVLDDRSRAMHKSLGNVVSPQEIVAKWGADVLRIWAAGSTAAEDARISPKLMEQHAERYKKFRNTLRFMLGNLHGFNPHEHGVKSYESLDRLERWALMNLSGLIEECRNSYESYDFPRVLRSLTEFAIHDLSNFYFDISKDRLYTFKEGDPDRRATQSVLFVTLHHFLTLMAPILPFTAEEAWLEMLGLLKERSPVMLLNVKFEFSDSCQLGRFPMACADWAGDDLKKETPPLLSLREDVHKKLDVLRKEGALGSSLEAKVGIEASSALHQTLQNWESLLPSVLVVSQIELREKPDLDGRAVVTVLKAEGKKCARCWCYHAGVGDDLRDPNLCAKCIRVLFD